MDYEGMSCTRMDSDMSNSTNTDSDLDLPPSLEDVEMWLPSAVLTDEYDDFLDCDDQDLASQKNSSNDSGGCSPILEDGITGTMELLDAALVKLKASEINWKHQNNKSQNSFTNSWEPWSAPGFWNLHQNAQQHPPQSPSSYIPPGWQAAVNPTQERSASNYDDKNYPPLIAAQGAGMGTQKQKNVREANVSGRECGGTGFFLPRRSAKGNDSRRRKTKPACSTVFLPYRVIQALNLNMEYLNGRTTVRDLYALRQDSIGKKRMENSKPISKDAPPPLLKRQDQDHQQRPVIEASTEISLPNDWTY